MEFKKGDVVICINSRGYDKKLIMNNQYTISDYTLSNNFPQKYIVNLKEYDDEYFYAHRFELDKKYYRKQKLKQLKNEI